ncbi:hypothetical protein [Bacillus sp. PK3_68]|uniref:hypothetical protein n=1 Tax=Bacillus sp. PK3_68 TaxID=2027408 RepID=UPI000E712E12|nr:hypothetical protein [Bacillus sp. PK3_68]RJS62411.1 hypothetical protein CJ483_22150 [Bacillus sp. PK3_68]
MIFEHEPFKNMTLDYKHCFLCGIELTKENKTDEHVIPTWLQHRHDLWNQRLTLLNGTSIPYRQLKIPCCQECNNVALGNIEKEIEKASISYQELTKLDKWTIFIWLVKLYYGLLFKNLSLVVDFKDPAKGTIVSPEQLSKFKMLHEFLQSTRISTKFSSEVFSLFTFKLHLHADNDRKYDFFFTDDHMRSQLAIQIGEIGIICCIGEDGIIAESLNDYITPFKEHRLHSIQFSELIAKIFYQRALLQVAPSYILINSKNNSHILSNMNSFAGEYFRETNFKEFGYVLARQLRRFNIGIEKLYYPDADAVSSFLMKDDGNLHLLDNTGVPIPDIKIKHPKYKGQLFPARK